MSREAKPKDHFCSACQLSQIIKLQATDAKQLARIALFMGVASGF